MPDAYEHKDHEHTHSDGSICREVNRRIYAFIDGKLEIEQLRDFKEHINQCVSCQTLVQFEKKLIQIIKVKGGQSSTQMPPSLKDKILKVFEMKSDSSDRK